jgi:hypothetical protein
MAITAYTASTTETVIRVVFNGHSLNNWPIENYAVIKWGFDPDGDLLDNDPSLSAIGGIIPEWETELTTNDFILSASNIAIFGSNNEANGARRTSEWIKYQYIQPTATPTPQPTATPSPTPIPRRSRFVFRNQSRIGALIEN